MSNNYIGSAYRGQEESNLVNTPSHQPESQKRLIHPGGPACGGLALGNICISGTIHCQKHHLKIAATRLSAFFKKIKIIYKYLYKPHIDR